MKKVFLSAIQVASIIGTLGGFVADVLTPLFPFSGYLFWLCLAIVVGSFTIWFVKYKKGRKRNDRTLLYENLPFKIMSFSLFSLPIIFMFYYLNLNAKGDSGFLGGNYDVIAKMQNTLFSIRSDIQKVDTKVDEANKTLNEIKDVIKSDSEIKNLSTTEDYSIVQDLNRKTKSIDAKRLAVIYFENSSEDKNLDKLSKGLASMLITDLSSVDMLIVVERDRIEEIIEEQKLSKTKGFDPTTAAKIGKLLGVEMILTGTYFELLGSLRIDSRIIDVETAKILHTSGVEGDVSNFFKLEKQMVWKIIKSLDLKLGVEESKNLEEAENSKGIDFMTANKFSLALEAYDNKNNVKASTLIVQILNQYPDFKPAIEIEKKIRLNLP